MSIFQFHAAKTGHANFAESVEEIKPLTEEEKRQRMEKYVFLMKCFIYIWASCVLVLTRVSGIFTYSS